MITCKIQWVDARGNATPDNNPAIGYVYREAYTLHGGHYMYGRRHFEQSDAYPICEDHASLLPIAHWVFVPLV